MIPPLAGPAPDERPPQACGGSPGEQVLQLVNGIRKRHGLHTLSVDARLVEAALVHSRDQAGTGRMAHTGTDGSTPGERVERAGYPWMAVSENVGAGYLSAAAIVAAWMDSPPHRATILSTAAVHAGVGYVFTSADPLRHYWTLNVAAPRPGGSVRLLTCHP